MRKAALFGAAAVLALSVGAQTAKADVDVTADIDKYVSIRIIEVVAKLKLVGLFALIVTESDYSAESQALFNQRNNDNKACENCAEKVFTLTNSMNGNRGITTLNAADGNMNNQGIAISIAFTGSGDAAQLHGFADAQASGTQLNVDNIIDTINVPFRDSVITNSVNRNTGVTALNTAPGNINNQAFALSIAVSSKPGVALSEADLGQVNARHTSSEHDVDKLSSITNSINGNRGVTSVNVAVGNLANQANVVAIAAAGVRAGN